jgi:hypothetical protein
MEEREKKMLKFLTEIAQAAVIATLFFGPLFYYYLA